MSSENSNINCASREGKVIKVHNNIVSVNILSLSACSGCHAKSVCSTFEKAEKIIDVSANGHNYAVGDSVVVRTKITDGAKATAIAYVVPLFIMLAILFVMIAIGFKEIIAGIISVLSVAVYYLALYLLKNRINKEFTFYIDKTN